MGCSDVELRRWLPIALPGANLSMSQHSGSGECIASYPDGKLRLEWRALPARSIALLQLPQLEVRFSYCDLTPKRREEVQRYFDHVTHRGGG
jgi:hypothetical protein